MAKKKIIDKKRLILIILVLIALSVIFLPSYTKLQDLKLENSRLEKRITDLQDSVRQLTVEKERLESDIIYIEKVAREKMGLIRKGETKIETE